MSYRGICAALALLLSFSFLVLLYVSRDVDTSSGAQKVRLSRKLISIREASLNCRCHVDGERKQGVWLEKKQTSRFDQVLAFLDLCQPVFREPLLKQNTPVENEHDITNTSEEEIILEENTQTTTPLPSTLDEETVIPPPSSSPLVCQMLIILLVLSATIAIVEVCRASLFTGEKKTTFPISGGGIAGRPKPGLGETGRRCSLADLTLSRHARRESLISSNSQSKLSVIRKPSSGGTLTRANRTLSMPPHSAPPRI